MRFRIEYIHAERRYVIARQSQPGLPECSESMTLGGIPVGLGLRPRALLPDGSPDYAVWSFILRNRNDASALRVGEEFELKT